ncbi:hypothetical protein OA264_01745, partial [Alphaproteobacteria bacterium]|nr:hypothetical protein [Alphaproteobacteria bacterium]
DLILNMKSIYRVLKKNGKFLYIFFSPDSCSKLKNIFLNILENNFQNMFMPKPNILLLGNLASSIGYKDIVVDKSNYFITSKSAKDIWKFLRDIGESNYLQTRNKNIVSKYNYHKLCESIEFSLKENGNITNEVWINYLIGTKKT